MADMERSRVAREESPVSAFEVIEVREEDWMASVVRDDSPENACGAMDAMGQSSMARVVRCERVLSRSDASSLR